MQKKTINNIISSKFDHWLKSVKDKTLRDDIRLNTIITGGCIASMFLNEDVNDFDVYFTNKETVLNVAKYYTEKFNKKHGGAHLARVVDGALPLKDQLGEKAWKSVMLDNIEKDRVKIVIKSAGVASEQKTANSAISEADDISADALKKIADKEDAKKDKKNDLYRPVYLSSNAITLSDDIQIVVRFYGNADEIHENFDFDHCMNYWTSKDEKLHTNVESLEAILSKTLVYNGSRYPLSSVIRTRKFIKRGFHINAGQYLKMFFQISRLDLNDVNVLEEQLVGVDTMYFRMLIEQLKEEHIKTPNFTIDDNYISTLVDKIF